MLLPVTPPQLLQASCSLLASEAITQDCQLSLAQSFALIRLGAVYRNRFRLGEDQRLTPGDYLRVYLASRRFPAEGMDWSKRIMANHSDYVIVDKPAGIPVHPTCDNGLENLAFQLTQFLGTPLKVVHRLDIPTQGLMVFGKTTGFVGFFNRALEKREIKKRYRALIPNAVATGKFVHHMLDRKRAPYWVEANPTPASKVCELEIEKVSYLAEVDAFEVEVTLITGRHHQIRSQLAFLGSPILGDSLYGSEIPAPLAAQVGDQIALQSFTLEIPGFSDAGQLNFTLPRPWLF